MLFLFTILWGINIVATSVEAIKKMLHLWSVQQVAGRDSAEWPVGRMCETEPSLWHSELSSSFLSGCFFKLQHSQLHLSHLWRAFRSHTDLFSVPRPRHVFLLFSLMHVCQPLKILKIMHSDSLFGMIYRTHCLLIMSGRTQMSFKTLTIALFQFTGKCLHILNLFVHKSQSPQTDTNNT